MNKIRNLFQIVKSVLITAKSWLSPKAARKRQFERKMPIIHHTQAVCCPHYTTFYCIAYMYIYTHRYMHTDTQTHNLMHKFREKAEEQ